MPATSAAAALSPRCQYLPIGQNRLPLTVEIQNRRDDQQISGSERQQQDGQRQNSRGSPSRQIRDGSYGPTLRCDGEDPP